MEKWPEEVGRDFAVSRDATHPFHPLDQGLPPPRQKQPLSDSFSDDRIRLGNDFLGLSTVILALRLNLVKFFDEIDVFVLNAIDLPSNRLVIPEVVIRGFGTQRVDDEGRPSGEFLIGIV